MATGIVCFGRGIEQVEEGLSKQGRWAWRPTAYLERLTPDGQHSGYRTEGLTLDSDDDRVVIAGAYANVVAMEHLFDRCVARDELPKLIIWAAGRPKYLENEPSEISEGAVLFEAFKNKLGVNADRLSSVEMQFQTQNKNTRDDLLQSLRKAKEIGLTELQIVSVLVHIQRIAVFLEYASKKEPSLAEIRVQLLASEVLLAMPSVVCYGGGSKNAILTYDLTISNSHFNQAFDHLSLAKIIESPVYRRTAAREANGIADLRAGRYKFS